MTKKIKCNKRPRFGGVFIIFLGVCSMAVSSAIEAEIKRKAAEGIALTNPTAETRRNLLGDRF